MQKNAIPDRSGDVTSWHQESLWSKQRTKYNNFYITQNNTANYLGDLFLFYLFVFLCQISGANFPMWYDKRKLSREGTCLFNLSKVDILLSEFIWLFPMIWLSVGPQDNVDVRHNKSIKVWTDVVHIYSSQLVCSYKNRKFVFLEKCMDFHSS